VLVQVCIAKGSEIEGAIQIPLDVVYSLVALPSQIVQVQIDSASNDAKVIAAETKVKVVAWSGHCEVHERFSAGEVRQLREDYPGVVILAHPECPPDVVAEADFSGSTAAMSAYVGKNRPARVVLLTECSMSDNVAIQYPELEFIRPCNLCPHMKRISLRNIRRALETMRHEVQIDPEIAIPARRAVERMLAVK
jgi:quinolinate synthase